MSIISRVLILLAKEAAFVDVELNDKSQQGLNIATDDLRKFIGYGKKLRKFFCYHSTNIKHKVEMLHWIIRVDLCDYRD